MTQPMPHLHKFFIILCVASLWLARAFAADRPNILMIVSEDNGPELGCYGLEPNEEIAVDIEPGKTLIVRFLTVSQPHEDGRKRPMEP